jgi:hypothetical protein
MARRVVLLEMRNQDQRDRKSQHGGFLSNWDIKNVEVESERRTSYLRVECLVRLLVTGKSATGEI